MLLSQDPSEASYSAGRVGQRHSDHDPGHRDQLSRGHRTHSVSLPGLA